MRLIGKTILLTGASSGIGRELAVQLAARGNRLLLVARRQELLKEVENSLAPCTQGHRSLVCDVGDTAQVEALCRRLLEEGEEVDLLLLNAGVSLGFDVQNIDLGACRRVMDVNFWGAVSFIKWWLPTLLKRRGIIAVVGSLAGYRGMPKAAPYSASKGALMNFIDSLRIDLYPLGVRCVLISPGFVDTPMTQNSRYPMPFMISAEKAASIIIRGLEREKTEIRFPKIMALSAAAARLFPNRFYAWLMSRKVG